jgi:hypothetical protein
MEEGSTAGGLLSTVGVSRSGVMAGGLVDELSKDELMV